MSTASRPRLLVVFGLRGTLLERLAVTETPNNIPRAPTHLFAKYNVWLRPGATQALQRLTSVADVAVWSATPMRNTVPLAQMAFPEVPFKFMWHRDHTSPDTLRRKIGGVSDRSDAHAVMKDLGKIYADYPNVYTPQRTVSVDDAGFKTRSHSGNLLLVPTFDVNVLMRESQGEVDATLDKMVDFIEKELVGVEDVRTVLPRKLV
eukprot:PhM_4_TR12190/c0_g1_i1/m.67092